MPPAAPSLRRRRRLNSPIDTKGQPILAANRTDYAGNPSPVDIFNTYDLHRYDSTYSTFASDISTTTTKTALYNVTPGATIQVDPGAHLSVGDAADALSDGVDHVNIVNNAANGFSATAGVKNIGNLSGPGSSSVAAGATLRANHFRQGALMVNGVALIRVAGTDSAVSKIGDLTISPAGALDLTNNNAVISDPLGSWDGSTYTDVTGQIARGRNTGHWDGPGRHQHDRRYPRLAHQPRRRRFRHRHVARAICFRLRHVCHVHLRRRRQPRREAEH